MADLKDKPVKEKVTYRPTEGEPEVVSAYGHTFEAGKSVEITDERQIDKLRGNPQFQIGKEKPAKHDADEEDEALSKAQDKTSKEAQKARIKANETSDDAQAKERAAAQVARLKSAAVDPDRDPPVTNHAATSKP